MKEKVILLNDSAKIEITDNNVVITRENDVPITILSNNKNIEIDKTVRDYPEVYVYGRVLPAKGIYFRYINGLTLENVKVETYRPDVRDDFVFYNVEKNI